jgi:hypothetical protein
MHPSVCDALLKCNVRADSPLFQELHDVYDITVLSYQADLITKG